MDDLESDFFNSTFKKIGSKSIKTSSSQDFDEEDPLADILSSTETTPRKKSTTSPAVLNTESSTTDKLQTKTKIITNLFGLDEPEQNESKVHLKLQDPSDWLGLKSDTDLLSDGFPRNRQESLTDASKVPTTPQKVEKSTADASDNRTNVNMDHYVNAVKSTTSGRRSHTGSVFQELLGKSSASGQKSAVSQNEQRKKESILNSFITADFDNKPPTSSGFKETNEYTAGLVKQGYSPSPGQEIRPRRGPPRKAVNLPDPLGLFTSTNTEKGSPNHQSEKAKANTFSSDSTDVTSTQPSRHDALDQRLSWLGSNVTVGTATPVVEPITSTPTQPAAKTNNVDITPAVATDAESPMIDTEVLKSLSNLELQVGAVAAQQQRGLISALALKRQEDLLLQLQTQHATLLKQHEQQLGALVQRQFQRQKQMMQQQELIQAHIEALMVQPPPIVPITIPQKLLTIAETPQNFTEGFVEKQTNFENGNTKKMTEFEDHIQKLQRENADLKFMVASQKQRYEDQLNEMEVLYRKTLALHEETIKKQGERFQNEREEMEKELAFRLTRLKEEHSTSSHQQAERMAELHSEWLADLRRLGEFHQQSVDMLRSEQTSTLEHWKNLQKAEIASVKEANAHTKLLETAVNDLKESSVSFRHLKELFSKETHMTLDSKRDDLHKQEIQLTGLRELLEKQALALEAERARMNVLSQDLEVRLINQKQEADDDRRRFESREREWTKEKARAVDYLEKEKLYVEKLQSESRAALAQLEQQKLDLAKEVASLETTLHLQGVKASQNTQQAEEMVAEARATLQAAQEAGREIEREKEELEALKRDLQRERQHLAKIEKDISAKEVQIQKETQQAAISRNEGLSALEEARRLERERTEHASDLAQRLLHLNERENNLAKEKLAVTLEWKRIQEFRDNATCSTCNQIASVPISSFKNSKDIIDPMPIIMKLEAEQAIEYATLNHSNYLPTLLESVSQ